MSPNLYVPTFHLKVTLICHYNFLRQSLQYLLAHLHSCWLCPSPYPAIYGLDICKNRRLQTLSEQFLYFILSSSPFHSL